MATQVATRKIDADTHFNLTVDYRDLRELLSRGQQAEASEMLWLDAQRIVDPETVRVDLTGSGVDYSFEAIGLKETAEQSFEILARGGTATIIGMIPQGTKIELDGPSFLSERRIQGSSMGSNRFRIDMPRYIEFYRQGRLKLDELVTQRMSLEGVNQAFDDMKQGHVARTVLVFD